MARKVYLGLFLLGLLVTAAASSLVTVPGYMDAEYYYAGGLRLAQGHGLTETILWNYLDEPLGLPHPSHTYWMPLPSLLSALGMLVGGQNFPAARLPFLLLAACLPPVTAWLAYSLTCRAQLALIAGLVAVFPGYYLPYLVTPEAFGSYALLGTLILLLGFSRRIPAFPRFVALGLLAGLMHLSRADGLLWLGGGLALAGWQAFSTRQIERRWWQLGLFWLAAVLVGYAAVTSFWYARNLQTYHTLLAPGGSKTLWLLDYNQTFTFDPAELNSQTWLAAGLGQILKARWDTLVANLKTLVGVQGLVFLLPLMLVGLWRLRRDPRVRFGVLMWLATFLFMTLAFPFSGSRGGFLHSGAAIQPLLWAAVPLGLEAFVAFGVRFRNWKTERAMRGFGGILVGLVAVTTLALYFQLVVGSDLTHPTWNGPYESYRAAESFLVDHGATPEQRIMVNNPPGYYVASGRSALVIPNGDEIILQVAARRYAADFLILEVNHVRELDDLYLHPGDRPGLKYLGVEGGTHFYQFIHKKT